MFYVQYNYSFKKCYFNECFIMFTNFVFYFRLMAKFSKKIVSKSLYVFILKESTPSLLNM